MELTVTVSKEHIRKGVQCSSDSCAVAKAIVELLPAGYSVSVLDGKITILEAKDKDTPGFPGYREFVLPPKVVTFIEDFDKGRGVYPMQFTINVELPTGIDTGDCYNFPTELPFNLDELIEPSAGELEELRLALFG
jgi:hypothetical protein